MVLQGCKDMHAKMSEVCIAPKTAVIVLNEIHKVNGKSLTGERLYKQFIRANSSCSWNRQLFSAIRKIKFVGYLRPHTILVYGTVSQTEALRNAWIKNILTAPDGFDLLYFGELPSLYVDAVNPASFTPLSDALCSIILKLNRMNISVTISTLKEHLERYYCSIEPPTDQVVYQAINNLMRERKICLTDFGYFVTSDAKAKSMDLIQQYERNNKENAGQGHTQTTTNPVKSHKGTQKQSTKPESKPQKGARAGALKRFFSIKSKARGKVKVATSIASGTSSGCSSQHSSQCSSVGDDDCLGNPQVPCSTIKHVTEELGPQSELTAEAVPFQMTQVEAYPGQMNDSLAVHCGGARPYRRLSQTDSEYDRDEDAELCDKVPEMYKFVASKPHRYKGMSHLNRKPHTSMTVKPLRHRRRNTTRDFMNSSSSTPSGSIKCRDKRKRISKLGRRTKPSTSNQEITPLTVPPDVSSIQNCSGNCVLQSSVTIIAESPIDNNKETIRPAIDGDTNNIAHHSTPKDETTLNKLKTKFNATGHTYCDECDSHGTSNISTPKIRKRSTLQCASILKSITSDDPNKNDYAAVFEEKLVRELCV